MTAACSCSDRIDSTIATRDVRGQWWILAHVSRPWTEERGEAPGADRDGGDYAVNVRVAFCPFCGAPLPAVERAREAVREWRGAIVNANVMLPRYVEMPRPPGWPEPICATDEAILQRILGAAAALHGDHPEVRGRCACDCAPCRGGNHGGCDVGPCPAAEKGER